MTLVGGVPLGIARRALDELGEIAKRKSRSMDGSSLAEDATVQVDLAQAEASVEAARALVFDSFGQAWETLRGGRENTLEERTRMTMSVVQAMRLCAQAVDVAFHRAGGGALYETSALQRCFRDLHAAGQHILFSVETWKRVGKSLLGIEQPTFML